MELLLSFYNWTELYIKNSFSIVLSQKIILVFLLLTGFLFSKTTYSQDKYFIATSIAAFDVIQQHEPSVEGRFEFRLDKSNWIFDPFIGIMDNSDKAKYIYLGVFSEFVFFQNFILAPSFAPGFYFKGKSKDLSFLLEFRSQLEVAYRFKNDVKIGLSFNHISNASIKPPNIGVESVAFTFIFPLN